MLRSSFDSTFCIFKVLILLFFFHFIVSTLSFSLFKPFVYRMVLSIFLVILLRITYSTVTGHVFTIIANWYHCKIELNCYSCSSKFSASPRLSQEDHIALSFHFDIANIGAQVLSCRESTVSETTTIRLKTSGYLFPTVDDDDRDNCDHSIALARAYEWIWAIWSSLPYQPSAKCWYRTCVCI